MPTVLLAYYNYMTSFYRWNRNWRYHKDLRLWITKETGTSPSQKVPGGEQGTYTFWDPENWGKERKDMAVLYADLEEKSVPVFMQGPGLILAQSQQGQTQAQSTGQQTQQQQQLQQGQVQQAQRGAFQMGMAGL
jgi:CCR4-NOT transcription complex subunit 2